MSEPTEPYASLAEAALKQLRDNDVGTFVKPAEAQYPHQWNWDAALVALGLAPHHPERAMLEIRSLLAGAWETGMVPHILYHHGASDYRPHPDFWRTDGHHPEGLPTSGLSQPPVLATCLLRIVEAAPTEHQAAWHDFLAETYPTLLAWHRWWHTARDPRGTGLVAILHPWESGSDDAPRFGMALDAIASDFVMPFTRGDRVHVDASERPSDEDYRRFIDLIDRYANLGWDDDALMEQAPFLVQDAFLNAVLHRADVDLVRIATILGQPHDEIDAWIAATQRAYPTLWVDAEPGFASRDLRTGSLLPHAGFAGFTALWARLATPEQAERLAQAFASPSYAGTEGDGYRIPTTAHDDPAFNPRRYWRGPVWIVVNWMLHDGFAAYGQGEEAATLRNDALDLVSKHGFHEHYDPRDGTPGGAAGFSWSAALTLDLLRAPSHATVEA